MVLGLKSFGSPAALRIAEVPWIIAISSEARSSRQKRAVAVRSSGSSPSIFAGAFKEEAEAVPLYQPLVQLGRARAVLAVGGQHHGQDQGSHGAPAVEELLFSNRGQEGIAVELDLVFFHELGGSHAGTVTTRGET